MEIYDIIMLTVLIGATIFGFMKGLAWQIAALASIFASYFVAFQFRDTVAGLISADPPWNVFLAMLILYLGSSLGIWLVFRLISDIIDRLRLREFDRQIGAILGLVKGGLLCVVVTLFAVTLLGNEHRSTIVRSYSGHYIARLLHDADPVMPQEVKGILRPYVENLDRQLGEPLPATASDPNSAPVPNPNNAFLEQAAEQAQRWADRTGFGPVPGNSAGR